MRCRQQRGADTRHESFKGRSLDEKGAGHNGKSCHPEKKRPFSTFAKSMTPQGKERQRQCRKQYPEMHAFRPGQPVRKRGQPRDDKWQGETMNQAERGSGNRYSIEQIAMWRIAELHPVSSFEECLHGKESRRP